MPYKYTTELVGSGQFVASGSQALSALQLQAETVFAQVGLNFILYDDTGLATSIRLLSPGAESPGVVVDGFNFPQAKLGDLVTGREFSFKASATYPVSRAFGAILRYTEKVSVQGNGGPRIIWQESFNGPPVPVQTAPISMATVVQAGSAVGYSAYPTPPPPILPIAYLSNPDQAVDRTSPTPNGTDYAISWRYVFRFPGRLPRPPLPNVYIG